jgi:hypothetical protein
MLCSIASGAVISQEHPYLGIVRSNVFGLTPIQIERVEQPSPPLPRVTLVGITTIFGDKRALFKLVSPGNGEPAIKEQSFILSEGRRDGPLEVLLIDETRATVRVKNSGKVMLLTFEAAADKVLAR